MIQNVETILIDSGFVSEAAVAKVEALREDGKPVPKVLGAVQRKSHHRIEKSTNSASKLSNPSLASSKRPWGSESSIYVAKEKPPWSGPWSASPTICADSIAWSLPQPQKSFQRRPDGGGNLTLEDLAAKKILLGLPSFFRAAEI